MSGDWWKIAGITYAVVGAAILGSAIAYEEGEDGLLSRWSVLRIAVAMIGGAMLGVPMLLLAFGEALLAWRRRRAAVSAPRPS